MADDRQILKEKIKLKKEIALKESQIDATQKSKDEKVIENEQVAVDIKGVETDNVRLEEQIQGLEEQISELDTEFKDAQLTAGRLRKMIKMANERYETEDKTGKKLVKELDALNESLDKVRRDIKREIDERKNLEYQLKTTQGRIDEMEGHTLAKMFVTPKLKKDERFFPKGMSAQQAAAEEAERLERDREAAEASAERVKRDKSADAKARAEAKAAGANKPVEEAKEEDLDLTM